MRCESTVRFIGPRTRGALDAVLAASCAVAAGCGLDLIPVEPGDPCVGGACPYPLVCVDRICVWPDHENDGAAVEDSADDSRDDAGPDGAEGDRGAEGGCLPMEACNGRDDDCDGETDEDWPDLGGDCVVGTGTCAASGLVVYDPTETATLCGASAGEPQPEACDGADNDCDGEIDEDDACQNHGSPSFELRGNLALPEETTGGSDTWPHFWGAFVCDDIDGDRFNEAFLFWPSAFCDWSTSDFDCTDDGVSGNSDWVYRIVAVDLNDPPEGAEIFESHYDTHSSDRTDIPSKAVARHGARGTEYYVQQQERIVRAERYVRSGGGQLVWSFTPVQATSQEYGCVAAGDLDGVAGDELVVAWRDDRDWVSVQGGAAGNATVELETWERPFACAVGDQDGDGRAEVGVLAYVYGTGAPADRVGHYLGVGLGLTGATLERIWTADFGASSASGGPSNGVPTGDLHLVSLDDDDRLDVVLGGRDLGYTRPAVFRASGAGLFEPAVFSPATLRETQNVAVFDIDSDGDLDLMGTNGAFARNDGHGGLTNDDMLEPGETFDIPRYVYACDLTNDGEADLVAVHRYDGRESVKVWTGVL